MIRPPFRPPLFHEPGTSTEGRMAPTANGAKSGATPPPAASGCCGRACGCHATGAATNSHALDSVPPTVSAAAAPKGTAAKREKTPA